MPSRHTLIEHMSIDHETELIFAKRLIYGRPDNEESNWPKNDDFLQQIVRAKEIFYNHLIYHFITEEEVLFNKIQPFLKDTGAIRILNMLLEQHIHLKKLFGDLDTVSTSKETLRLKMQDIGSILENHIHLEEDRLFPLINKEVPKEILDKLWEEFQEKPRLETKQLL